jgi:hypothetical protein
MAVASIPFPEARHAVEVYLRSVDAEAPGLVEGLYLVGSVALGEFRPRTSDVDFVAVTAEPPDAASRRALARVHRRLRRSRPIPPFDGVYVTREELARDPLLAGPGPHARGGRFRAAGPRDCNPVTWHTLALRGAKCRGPAPSELGIPLDRAALASWTLGNFDRYWRPLLRRARRPFDPWSVIALSPYGVVWIVLGVCRLHATLATGDILSKEAAGEYGLRTFDATWHPLLEEALRIRREDRARADFRSFVAEWRLDPAPSRLARRRAVLGFATVVIEDAKARFGNAAPLRRGRSEPTP